MADLDTKRARVLCGCDDCRSVNPSRCGRRHLIRKALRNVRREGREGVGADGLQLEARELMTVKLVAAARILIAENERTADSSHGSGYSGRERWLIDDPDNFDAVGDLRTWCDAISPPTKAKDGEGDGGGEKKP